MKIALLGYGKMGKAIEKMALDQGHDIVLKVSREQSYDLSGVDVAIDFSVPEMATTHIKNCLEAQVAVVSGTTGWLDQFDEIVALCNAQNGAFLYASNFSIGVNLFFEITNKVAQIMDNSTYDASIKEIHHTQKLDAPSGTAMSIAKAIIDNSSYTNWELIDSSQKELKNKPHTIGITAERTASVPGTHELTYNSPIDTIRLTHQAHTREGFVQGALLAACWLEGKKGVFSMKDVLNIS
ncbi:MAG: 4-hydroxy-tetrahydrodipicolinate reductase [Cytophagaceae bacterium]|nr:4-hydroxy-tetrahydrodipicolinate reductase [Cytophagaceae bacterium]